MRKRINNDFDALVEVFHEGVKIDLSLYEITSVRMVSNQAYPATDYEIRNGSLFLHVTPLIVPKPGKYKIVVSYRIADPTLADGFWNYEFDKHIVTIVGCSEEEDAGEVVITADAVIGMQGKSAYQVWLEAGNTGTVEDYLADIKGDPFTYANFTPAQLEALKVKGDKGDPFTYDDFTPAQLEALKVKGDKGDPFLYSDFTPEQIAELQQPATDAVTAVNEAEALRVTAENTRVQNEQGRVTAEGIRQSNETARVNAENDRVEAEALRLSAETTRGQSEQARVTAEGLRVTAEQTRQTNTTTAIQNANNAATNANTKAGLADTAANNANAKATLANDAATLANEKAGLANDAATTANNAAEAVAPSVINNEEVQAEVYNLLNARIAALEAIIAAGVYNYIQADTLIGVQSLKYKGAEMILTGTAAPAIAPDFVGQIYVNTTGGVTYMAKGIASAADWKQTSN